MDQVKYKEGNQKWLSNEIFIYQYRIHWKKKKKDGNTNEIQLSEKAERRPRYGGYGVTPRLGNWDIKPMERDLWPYSTLAYVGTQSLNIQEATQHQGAV